MLTVVQERWIETLIVSIFLVLNIAFSQESILYHVPPENISSGESVKIIVSLFSDSRVLESKLFIRSTNSLNYIEEDLSFNGSSWQYDIPGDRITQVGLEYAIVFRLDDGSTLAFPRGDPLKNPFNLVIGPPKKRTRSFERRKSYFQDSKEFQMKDFLVLSPEPGSTIPPGDELIAVSFFNIPDIDTTSIKITIDGQDLTSLASIGGGIISLIPGAQDPGPHSIIVESMTKYDQPIRPLSWMFNTGKGEWSIMDEISYSGKVDGRASAQASGEQIVSYSEINGKFNLDLKWAGFKGTTRLNTRDSPFAQPLNRFSGNIYFGKYLNLYTGDFYPSLSQFTIDGRRVRGMGIDLDLKWLKVQSVRGELNSPVQRLGGVDGGLLLMNNETSIDSATGNPIFFLERTGYTFKRNISAMRFFGELFSRFKFGLHYLKAKDDIGSIDLAIDDYGTFNVDSSAYAGLSMDMSTGNYTYDKFLQVAQDNNALVDLTDTKWNYRDPEDNLVVGFDIGTIMDKRRLDFTFTWNMSLFNRDIWEGPMSLSEMDLALDDSLDGIIGRQYDDNGIIIQEGLIETKDLPDPLGFSDIFTVNINMTPLVPIDAFAFDEHPIASIVNMPSSAFNMKLAGNYPLSKFIVEYRQVGPEFVSLGNPFLASNIREFLITNRMALLDAKLMLTTGFKHRDNKILETVANPLNTNTLTMNLSFLPGAGAPSYILNIQSISKNNEKEDLDRIGESLVDNRDDNRATNVLLSLNYPVTYRSIKHNLVLNYNTVINTDKLSGDRASGYFFSGSDSKSITVSIASRFQSPLRTMLNLSAMDLLIPSLDMEGNTIKNTISWKTFGLNGKYSLPNNKINLTGGLSYIRNKSLTTVSSIFDFRGGADYKLRQDITLSFTGRLQAVINETSKEIKLNTSGILMSFRYNF
ncbi:uncharacterized protein METZ01_LOCUS51188 [marine metagenome]|uniref:Uncharacterized protein n=1 Tax=marine metagenome TaxID=408172 RepID=A0A381S4H5_9ZZZZ